jgi:hypothetical protein
MAGTIAADTLTHSTAGSLDTSYVVNGSAKAWANFNGTGTVATRQTFNQTSLTDLGTGSYDLSFVNNMNNATYNVTVGGAYSATATGSAGFGAVAMNDLTTSDYHLESGPYGTGPQPADIEVIMPSVTGDLA